MTTRALRVAAFPFFSGTCALVYQTAWFREFRLIFGASTAASAAVLAIFMGGLGLGSWLLGDRADRAPRPLAYYANLELGIAVSAALTPLFLWIARAAYVAVGGTTVLGTAGGTVVRLALSALVLGVPTVLMGGTLPAAARAAENERDEARRNLAVLYGLNTLGAVTGAALSTFFLLEHFGNRRTLWLAAVANVAVAIVARTLAARMADDAREAEASAPEEDVDSAEAPHAPPSFVLAAAGIVGFAFFLMEIVWYRMLGPILGGSSFTFGLILAVALFGIGAGGALYAMLSGGRQGTVAAFALTCALEALFVAVPYALGDRIAILAALLRPLGNVGFAGHVLAWTLVTSIVVFPVALVAGVQFPLLISLLGRGREAVGRHVGHAYAANTLGAIVGSLAGGFGILPVLTAPGTWRAVALLLVALAAAAVAVEARGRVRLVRYAPTAVALVVALALLTATGPTAAWRHSPIGAGRADLSNNSRNQIRAWVDGHRRIVWEAEGVESSVALADDDGYSFIVNGKVDGNARGDAGTQIMSGLLSAILHPNPTSAMVVGLGTGSTAGWLGAVPTMERVDVVELEPAILHVAEACAPVNQDVLRNPKVRVAMGDAREALMTTRRSYDLIFSEPSNPYRAGVASLYTRDFYTSAAQRLNDGGLFVQWVQAYEVDGQTVRTIMATLASVFPTVEVWRSQSTDLILVASTKPMTYDVARLRERVGQEPFRTALRRVWRATDLEGVLAHYVASDALAREALRGGAGDLNTDDRNVVEFGFARTVGITGVSPLRTILDAAVSRNEDRPVVPDGSVDWDRVLQERLSFEAQYHAPLTIPPAATGEARQRALVKDAYRAGDVDRAVAMIRSTPYEPTELFEAEIFADCLANVGDEGATRYVEMIRADFPAEADIFMAELRLRQRRGPEAVAHLTAALTALRTDPWTLTTVMPRAMDYATDLASVDPSGEAARRLYDAMSVPYCVGVVEEARLRALVKVAVLADGGSPGTLTQRALHQSEPYVQWVQDSLTLRRDCYAATGDPLRARAQRDLDEFMSAEPRPF
jgi:spermidine synthase